MAKKFSLQSSCRVPVKAKDGMDGKDGTNWTIDNTTGKWKRDGLLTEHVAIPKVEMSVNSDHKLVYNGTIISGSLLGQTGKQGDKGDKGDKGDQGDQGAKGDKGDKGNNGLTPYIKSDGKWGYGETLSQTQQTNTLNKMNQFCTLADVKRLSLSEFESIDDDMSSMILQHKIVTSNDDGKFVYQDCSQGVCSVGTFNPKGFSGDVIRPAQSNVQTLSNTQPTEDDEAMSLEQRVAYLEEKVKQLESLIYQI